MRHQLMQVAVTAVVVVGALCSGAWGHSVDAKGPAGIPSGSSGRDKRFDYDAPPAASYVLPVIKPATDGLVIDSAGERRRLHQVMEGRIVLLSFIYSRCSDANGCPLATGVLHQIRQAAARDAEIGRHLKLVTVTFDLGNDTPAVMARYAEPLRSRAARATPWDFLVPVSQRALGTILSGYGQAVTWPTDGAAPPGHLLRVYLVDRSQRVRNIYGLDFLDPRLLLVDVHTLLLEERGIRK